MTKQIRDRQIRTDITKEQISPWGVEWSFLLQPTRLEGSMYFLPKE